MRTHHAGFAKMTNAKRARFTMSRQARWRGPSGSQAVRCIRAGSCRMSSERKQDRESNLKEPAGLKAQTEGPCPRAAPPRRNGLPASGRLQTQHSRAMIRCPWGSLSIDSGAAGQSSSRRASSSRRSPQSRPARKRRGSYGSRSHTSPITKRARPSAPASTPEGSKRNTNSGSTTSPASTSSANCSRKIQNFAGREPSPQAISS